MELSNGYYIESGRNGSYMLKKRYSGIRNGVETECSKNISYHQDFTDAAEAFLRLMQKEKTDKAYANISDYIKALRRANTEAVESVRRCISGKQRKSKEEVARDNAEANRIFATIPYGHFAPLPRPSNRSVDRQLRELISAANQNGDCIINVGDGYYRPVKDDPVDEMERKKYIARERDRAKSVLDKYLKMSGQKEEG